MSTSELKQGGPSGPSSLSQSDKRAIKRLVLTVVTLFICLWIGPAAVLSGVLFGALTFVALYGIMTIVPGFDKLVKSMGSFVDVAATVLTFIVLGGTLTAAFGAATVGCLFTVMVTMKRFPGPKGYLDSMLERAQKYCEEKSRDATKHPATDSHGSPAGDRPEERDASTGEQPSEGGGPADLLGHPDLQAT